MDRDPATGRPVRPRERSAPRPLEGVARRLYATLTDGADDLRFNVCRGYAVRDAVTRSPDRRSFTTEWRPAVDRSADGTDTPRSANPFVLLAHLEGRYDVAIAAPTWSSLVVLDI